MNCVALQAFAQMGEVAENAKIVPDRSGNHTTYGFVEFADGDTARRGII